MNFWPHRRLLALAACVAACVVATLGPDPALALGKSGDEYRIKAAMLYNVARFVAWPDVSEGADERFVIVVYGRDPFGASLEEVLRGRKIAGRKIVIRRTRSFDEVLGAHIIFTSDSSAEAISALMRAAGSESALLVGDSELFCRRGGPLALAREGSRVRLVGHRGSLAACRVQLSSQLLKLVRFIDESGLRSRALQRSGPASQPGARTATR